MTQTTDLNKYANDNNVKWIVAKRHYDGEWVIRYVSILDESPTLENILDETPLGEMKVSEFAVFKNRPNWWMNKRRRYYRGCDVPVYFNAALGSLINARESDWF